MALDLQEEGHAGGRTGAGARCGRRAGRGYGNDNVLRNCCVTTIGVRHFNSGTHIRSTCCYLTNRRCVAARRLSAELLIERIGVRGHQLPFRNLGNVVHPLYLIHPRVFRKRH